jgi:eukaryotic-like serine/threonine-protein kinase
MPDGNADLRPDDHDATRTGFEALPPTLETPPGQPSANAAGSAAQTGPRYVVVRPHARGGLGEIFLARDCELPREVALKELQPERAHDPPSQARFLLEAEVTATLEHPGVVPVYGLGRHADGRPFYAMRFVRGETLKEASDRFHAAGSGTPPRERRLALRQLLTRFVAVCNTLAYAHSRGVLHRDLKPANILLGEYGETLVVDWGLAKATAQPDGEQTEQGPGLAARVREDSATEVGNVLGTPAYMSPEQAEGRPDRLGPASDVYSLGATLYHVLTGRPPFSGSAASDTLARVRRGDFPPPRRVRPEVPAALEAVCLKAMARRPEDRYGSALELAAEVEHWLADEPVSALREPWTARLGRWARRHRTLVAAAAALLVTAVAALSVSTVLIGLEQAETEEARRLAEANFRDARQQQARAEANLREAKRQEGLARESAAKAREQQALAEQQRQRAEANFQKAQDAVDQMLTEVGQRWLADVPLMDPIRRKLLEKALTFYQGFLQEKGDDPRLRRRTLAAHRRLGSLYDLLGQKERAEQALLEALRLAERLADEPPRSAADRREVASAHNNLGILYKNTGRLAQARESYGKALDLLRRLVKDFPKQRRYRLSLANTLHNLGNVLEPAGETQQAREAHGEALALRRRLVDESPRDPVARADLATGLNGQGLLLLHLGEHRQAGEALRRAVELRQDLASELADDPENRHKLAGSLHNLAAMLDATGQQVEAEKAYRSALSLSRKLVDDFPTRPNYRAYLANHQGSLARLLSRFGRHKEAEALLRDCLAARKKLADDMPNNPGHRLALAYAEAQLGRRLRSGAQLAQAREAYLRGLAVREQLVKQFPDRPEFRQALGAGHEGLAQLLRDLKQPGEAREHHLRALDARRKLAAAHPRVVGYRHDLAQTLYNLGSLYSDIDQPADARAAYLEARALWQRLTEEVPANPDYRHYLAGTHYNMGNLLHRFEKAEDAEPAYRSALPLQRRLAEEFPGVPRYRSLYAATLNNLAGRLAERGELREARSLLEEAIVHQRAARKANATHLTYRLFLRNHHLTLATVLLRLGEHAGAADNARQLPALYPKDWREHHRGAELLARCVALARKDAALPAPKGEDLARAYADQAVRLLQQAVENGLQDPEVLRANPDLEPLRDRADFQALLKRLEQRKV